RSLSYEYVSQGRKVVESQHEMFKRCELPSDSLRALREHCDQRDVIFFSTPSSTGSLKELMAANAPMLKNGSDYLTHLPLIEEMARTGLPTVISTGMATRAEINDAVQAFRSAGGRNLILLHCTSSYPTAPADLNLRKIAALREEFECPTGLSDHSEGTVAAMAAVALGACMIEKHFTLDKTLPGPDHHFSADPEEFRKMAQGVRMVETMLGTAELGPASSEQSGRQEFRLSCVADRQLPIGHRLTESDIAFRRPGIGFPPKDAGKLIARHLARSIAAGHIFRAEDFE
ncbi:MAG: N-acetylneuraminate synthase family protein, partial [Acidobacteriales bacterium]|nr:N-acetylneuraminate synthase family protein [Terriglobales bacterium]